MSRLLLAEHAYQVEDLVRRGLSDQDKWIALGPSAMASLETLNLDYQIPEDFYNAGELDEFCDHTHELVERLCDYLDGRIIDLSSAVESTGLRPFRFHIFPLMMVFDGVRSRLFQLQKIFGAYPNHSPSIHKGKVCDLRRDDLLFSNDYTLWGHLASLPGWNAQLDVLPDPSLDNEITSQGSASSVSLKLKDHILKSVRLTTVARLWSSRNYRGLWNLLARNRDVLLVVNAPYEWANILPKLTQAGWKILFVSERCFRDQKETDVERPAKSFDKIESDPVLTSYFKMAGIDYYPLLKTRLASIWESSPQQFEGVTRKVAELSRRYKISALLRCSSASGIDHAINESARRMGVPVFVWQHGAVSHYRRITQFRDYADLMSTDYAFVFGEDVAEAYAHYGRTFPAKVIPVGAPSLDSIASSDCAAERTDIRRKKRVLYATSNYMQNHWYYGWTPPYSDRQLLRDQIRILEYLRAASERGSIELIVKLHPAAEYSEPPWVANLRLAGVRIVKGEESFEDMLKKSEAIVLDFPSTTLLQAIATERPVFVLTSHCFFPEQAQLMLSKRAVTADNTGDLILALQGFVESGVNPADVSDKSFLKAYGTHLNDGESASRAISILSGILAGEDRFRPEVLATAKKEGICGLNPPGQPPRRSLRENGSC